MKTYRLNFKPYLNTAGLTTARVSLKSQCQIVMRTSQVADRLVSRRLPATVPVASRAEQAPSS
ncbi:hypothetical protein BN903_75 [Halorubrum sp. AJ67]|nr:hypothetical protein BN903_75 [Halorubrum sp. AJ67]